MPLRQRILKVTLDMPTGVVVLDQTLDLKIRVHKDALAIQNRASIEVTGLSTKQREYLLSHFTAWIKREVNTGVSEANLIPVKIEAGWGGVNAIPSIIFKGEVALVEPVSGPPNVSVRITAFTHQIDKTQYTTTERPPAKTTYKNYVLWAAKQMGFGDNVDCQTSFDNEEIDNPARSIYTYAGLLIDIQNIYRPAVAAFVDNDRLIVKDMNKIINPNEIANVDLFVGIPSWTEWGVEFTTLFNPDILLAHGANLTSRMNDRLNGIYVLMSLDYDLNSRSRNFYVKAQGSPSANV